MFVVPITEREDAVMKLLHAREMLETKLLVKGLHSLRCIPIAIGTCQDQSIGFGRKSSGSVTNQRGNRSRVALSFEFSRQLAR